VTADESEQLGLYSVKDGSFKKPFYSKKYGCHLARFTHQSGNVLYASTKGDDAIRYLDLHKNTYQRYFPGHTGTVTSLSVNPSNDTFLTSSLDNSTRLWALNTQNPVAVLNITSPYLSAYDPTATVIAIGCPASSAVLLYDIRNVDKSPFAMFELRAHENTYAPAATARWTTLEFSNDGKRILVGAAGEGHYVLDAFSGSLQAFLQRPTGKPSSLLAAGQPPSSRKAPSSGDCCFTPDGRYVMSGAGSANVLVYDLATEKGISRRPTVELEYPAPAAVIKWNPRFGMFATASKECVFWLPDDHAPTDNAQ
jgi:COMPASS component SWD2